MNGRTNVTLLGNLTSDIEKRTTTTGKSVAGFTIAVNHGKDEASFIDCVAWEQTAEFLAKYSKKGQTLYLEGTLKQNKFKDKDGNNRSKIEVVVRGAEILSRDDRPLQQHEALEQARDVVPEDVDDAAILLSEIPF